MAKTFMQMVSEAQAAVPGVSPAEAKQRLEQDSNTLIVDIRDTADIPITGKIPGSLHVSYWTLPFKADQELPEEWREPQLQDRSRPIITTCEGGPMGALAAKLLKDMGFANVSYLDGGAQGWKDAGYVTQ
jgi:rhodanese-related sulfurtransferase